LTFDTTPASTALPGGEARGKESLMPGRSLIGSCHCGAVRVTLPRRPRSLTSCNCSICRRYGALWAYYRGDAVRFDRQRGATIGYVWGTGHIRFVRCATCGCVTHWERTRASLPNRVGVNIRLFDPEDVGRVQIHLFDGARTWKRIG
jgi:hypothetical protein